MATLPARYDISVTQGANWRRSLRVITTGTTLLDTADYTARAQIRASLDDAVALELTTENGRIQVGHDPPPWQASTAYAVGQGAVPPVLNGYVYEATVAGTSGASQPTWPTVVGTTVVDGTVTWRCASTDRGVTNLRLIVPATVSAALADWGLGVWDLELVDPYGDVQRLLEGQAVLSREATH